MIRIFQKYHLSMTLLVSLPLILLLFSGAGYTIFELSRKWVVISANERQL